MSFLGKYERIIAVEYCSIEHGTNKKSIPLLLLTACQKYPEIATENLLGICAKVQLYLLKFNMCMKFNSSNSSFKTFTDCVIDSTDFVSSSKTIAVVKQLSTTMNTRIFTGNLLRTKTPKH